MSRRPCSVEGCNVGASRDGLCSKHSPNGRESQVLPMEPLVALVESKGGIGRCVDISSNTARNYYQAKKRGAVSPARADRLAHEVLGCHPCEVWPTWFGPYGLTV